MHQFPDRQAAIASNIRWNSVQNTYDFFANHKYPKFLAFNKFHHQDQFAIRFQETAHWRNVGVFETLNRLGRRADALGQPGVLSDVQIDYFDGDLFIQPIIFGKINSTKELSEIFE